MGARGEASPTVVSGSNLVEPKRNHNNQPKNPKSIPKQLFVARLGLCRDLVGFYFQSLRCNSYLNSALSVSLFQFDYFFISCLSVAFSCKITFNYFLITALTNILKHNHDLNKKYKSSQEHYVANDNVNTLRASLCTVNRYTLCIQR